MTTKTNGRAAKVRSFSATDEDVAMLEAVARYHGFSKSATLVGLVRRVTALVSGRRTPPATPFGDDTATVLPDAKHAQPEAALPEGAER